MMGRALDMAVEPNGDVFIVRVSSFHLVSSVAHAHSFCIMSIAFPIALSPSSFASTVRLDVGDN